MQDAEPGRLAVRGARWDPKPLLVVRQLLYAAQIELGGYAQSGKRVRLAVGGADQEFTRIQPVHVLRGAVGNRDMRIAVDFADREHQRRAGLGRRPGQSLFRETAINDVARFRWDKEAQSRRLRTGAWRA